MILKDLLLKQRNGISIDFKLIGWILCWGITLQGAVVHPKRRVGDGKTNYSCHPTDKKKRKIGSL